MEEKIPTNTDYSGINNILKNAHIDRINRLKSNNLHK